MQQESKEAKVKRLKEAVVAAVDSRHKELIDISLEIHNDPELAFKEFKASKLLADYLRSNGFSVEYGAYDLETAFKATIGSSVPRIAILAEYDALEGVGHGCGHNIIGTAAAGAGVALALVIKELGGTVVVFGTPAEEGGNGKELMAKRGAFNDIDAAMMIHPLNRDFLPWDCPGLALVNVEYFGKAAHPAIPEKGINALDAMLVGFTAFSALRQRILSSAAAEEVVVSVILKGGVGAHIIPDHTTAQIIALATSDDGLKALLDRVQDCFKAGAVATGARLEFQYDWDNRYRALRTNRVVCELFNANMRSLRPDWNPAPPRSVAESAATDMGTVSQITPSIHVGIAIAPSDVGWHSVESAAAAASDEGLKAMLDGAKAMAMTTIDLIVRPDILKEAQDEFEAYFSYG